MWITFFESLEDNKSLRTLHMSGNSISQDVLTALVNLLETNNSITAFKIGDCRIRDTPFYEAEFTAKLSAYHCTFESQLNSRVGVKIEWA